jgi:hypothetical protein
VSFFHTPPDNGYTYQSNTTFPPPQNQAEGFDPVVFALDRLEQKLVDFGARLDSRLDEISERLSNLEIHELQDLERDLREAA